MVVMVLGQTRVFFSMANDGLLPPWANRVIQVRTPHVTTVMTARGVDRRGLHADQHPRRTGQHRHACSRS